MKSLTLSCCAAMFSLPWMIAPDFFAISQPGDNRKSRFSGVAAAKRRARKLRNRRG